MVDHEEVIKRLDQVIDLLVGITEGLTRSGIMGPKQEVEAQSQVDSALRATLEKEESK